MVKSSPIGGTVLVVDDDALVRLVGVAMMEDLGFAILEAESGEAALEIIRERPDIVLLFTDVRMPGMDGIHLAQEAVSLRPDLKVIFVSGYRAGNAPLPAPLVAKPYGPTELKRAVDLQLASGDP
jgi:CheY-like chemotaxis protein